MEDNKRTDEAVEAQPVEAVEPEAVEAAEPVEADVPEPAEAVEPVEAVEPQPTDTPEPVETATPVDDEFAPAKEDASGEFAKARPKVYDKHKGWQIAGGIFSAALIWFLLGVGSNAEGLLSWLWVIVFGVVFIGKNRIERNKNIFFKPFTFAMLGTLIALLLLSVLFLLVFPDLLRSWGLEV